MTRMLISFTLFSFVFCQNIHAQKIKAKPKKQVVTQPQKKETSSAASEFIRTNNADTLYFDLDNSIILTPKSTDKNVVYKVETTNGDLSKLGTNFYILGNLKDKTVTVTVTEEKTKKKVAEKKYVVAVQKLPF